jgi:hypothetical protein
MAFAPDDNCGEYKQRERRDARSNGTGYPAPGQDLPRGDQVTPSETTLASNTYHRETADTAG